MRARYEDISHFRAPYKDSMYAGYGVYEHVAAGKKLHGTGEYMPVSGMGEYEMIRGFGATDDSGSTVAAPASAGDQIKDTLAQTPAPLVNTGLLQSVGGLTFATDSGATMVATFLAQWQDKLTAFAYALAGGDGSVVFYVGYDTPPAGSEPGPYSSLSSILSQYATGGWVILTDSQLTVPLAGKRSFIITKNPDVVAQLAKAGGGYFLTPGADPTIVAAAQAKLSGSLLAGLGPVGIAAVVAVGGVVAYAVFGGKKRGGKAKRKGRR